jgi:hypothetical protein
VQLIKRHFVFQQLPAEFGLVVDIAHFPDRVRFGSGSGVELLGDERGGSFELFQERRGDGEEVDTRKGKDFADLRGTSIRTIQKRLGHLHFGKKHP